MINENGDALILTTPRMKLFPGMRVPPAVAALLVELDVLEDVRVEEVEVDERVEEVEVDERLELVMVDVRLEDEDEDEEDVAVPCKHW
jgi:hypothetical protein